MTRTSRVLCAFCLFIAHIGFPAVSGAASAPWLRDHMPFWLWADTWDGVMAYALLASEKGELYEGFYEEKEDVEILSRISLDQRGINNNYVFWHADDPGGRASYYHDRREAKVVEIKFGQTHERFVAPGSVQAQRLAGVGMRIKLCAENTWLSIEHDRDRQVGSMAAPERREISGSLSEAGAIFQPKPISDFVVLLEEISVSDALPEPYAGFDVEVDRLGGPRRGIIGGDGMDDDNDYTILAWQLDPVHELEQWRERYAAILHAQRRQWVERWQTIQREHEQGKYNNAVGRAAAVALRNHDRWVEQLLRDADRVFPLLLHGEIKDFLPRMSVREPRIARAVVEGPEQTMALIHEHLWSFVPDMASGSMRLLRSRLPCYLLDLYPTMTDLKNVLVMPRQLTR